MQLAIGKDQQEILERLRSLPELDLPAHPGGPRRLRRSKQHEMTRSIQRIGDRRPQARSDRQPTYIAKDKERTPPIPGLGQTLKSALDGRREPTVSGMTIGDKRRITDWLSRTVRNQAQVV